MKASRGTENMFDQPGLVINEARAQQKRDPRTRTFFLRGPMLIGIGGEGWAGAQGEAGRGKGVGGGGGTEKMDCSGRHGLALTH